MSGRAVPEWIGATPDAVPPPRVKLRVFDAHKGVCHICTVKISGKAWDTDHVKALINEGENRESNLAPAHDACHTVKTANDVAEKSAIAASRKKFLGITKSKNPIPGSRGTKWRRRMDGTVERRND